MPGHCLAVAGPIRPEGDLGQGFMETKDEGGGCDENS